MTYKRAAELASNSDVYARQLHSGKPGRHRAFQSSRQDERTRRRLTRTQSTFGVAGGLGFQGIHSLVATSVFGSLDESSEGRVVNVNDGFVRSGGATNIN